MEDCDTQHPLFVPAKRRHQQKIRLTLRIHTLAFFLCLCISINAVGKPENNPPVADVDAKYQTITTSALRSILKARKEKSASINTVAALYERASDYNKQEKATASALLILSNLALVEQDIENKKIPGLVNILLAKQFVGTASQILAIANRQGSTYQQAKIRFAFARYYSDNNRWNETLEQLKSINISSDLDKTQGDEALILFGAALQHNREHREAIKYYSRIGVDSPHYANAQLNIATAYIRQDWWTDAKIALENAIAASSKASHKELTNRLYTVLGFLQLQHGFYRNARDSFRKVELQSHYSNRALLGLGLAALSEEDYVGAINAFNILKKKDDQDISVIESYLLYAYALEQLGQNKTSSASFTEAITFYENKLLVTSTAIDHLGTDVNSVRYPYGIKSQSDKALSSINDRLNSIHSILSYNLPQKNKHELEGLQINLREAYIASEKKYLQEQQSIITSYLSQSRFGLAKVYDKK